MAKTLLADLFPASTGLVQQFAPWLYDKIFPQQGPLCERTLITAEVAACCALYYAAFACADCVSDSFVVISCVSFISVLSSFGRVVVDCDV